MKQFPEGQTGETPIEWYMTHLNSTVRHPDWIMPYSSAQRLANALGCTLPTLLHDCTAFLKSQKLCLTHSPRPIDRVNAYQIAVSYIIMTEPSHRLIYPQATAQILESPDRTIYQKHKLRTIQKVK